MTPAEPQPLDPHLAYEEWPDGTFGGNFHSPSPPPGWTPGEQAAHRAELEAAIRTPAA
ncbi:hypothetical protein ACWFR1_34190 [Streptomyces sp. NPDC055103]